MSQTAKQPQILVIDDDETFAKVLSKRLEELGYAVSHAATGEEGLASVRARKPDLILLDTILPKMKGREVCAQLKSDPDLRDIPVIFLTGLGMADHIKAGLDVGADDYIVKPFEPNELRDRIEIVLLRRQDGSSEAG